MVERAEALSGSWQSLDALTYSSLPSFDTALETLERGLADVEEDR